MAVGAALLAGYLRRELAPDASPWLGWVAAAAILAASVSVNHLGIRACARVQLALVVGALAPITVLTTVALLGGEVNFGHLAPFAPPGGWGSWHAVAAILGAFFLAGWSAYAAEIALTYAPEYRGGSRGAVRSLLVTGVVMVLVYTLVPFVVTATVGVERASTAPERTLALLAGGGSVANALLAIALVSLVLGLNSVAAANSRVLFQMARNGDAWSALGRLNRRGTPANALRFDAAVNAVLLALAIVVTGGNIGAVPVTLLTAASVAYLLSLVLAIVAAVSVRRARARGRSASLARSVWIRVGCVVATVNVAFVAGAGTAWGWRNVGLGVAVLVAVVIVAARPRTVGIRASTRAVAGIPASVETRGRMAIHSTRR